MNENNFRVNLHVLGVGTDSAVAENGMSLQDVIANSRFNGVPWHNYELTLNGQSVSMGTRLEAPIPGQEHLLVASKNVEGGC